MPVKIDFNPLKPELKTQPIARKTRSPLQVEAFDPEGSGYDYVTAKAHGLEPDETGHWPSRSPRTGQILKGQKHPTYNLTVEGEKQAGYEIYKKGKRYYSQAMPKIDFQPLKVQPEKPPTEPPVQIDFSKQKTIADLQEPLPVTARQPSEPGGMPVQPTPEPMAIGPAPEPTLGQKIKRLVVPQEKYGRITKPEPLDYVHKALDIPLSLLTKYASGRTFGLDKLLWYGLGKIRPDLAGKPLQETIDQLDPYERKGLRKTVGDIGEFVGQIQSSAGLLRKLGWKSPKGRTLIKRIARNAPPWMTSGAISEIVDGIVGGKDVKTTAVEAGKEAAIRGGQAVLWSGIGWGGGKLFDAALKKFPGFRIRWNKWSKGKKPAEVKTMRQQAEEALAEYRKTGNDTKLMELQRKLGYGQAVAERVKRAKPPKVKDFGKAPLARPGIDFKPIAGPGLEAVAGQMPKPEISPLERAVTPPVAKAAPKGIKAPAKMPEHARTDKGYVIIKSDIGEIHIPDKMLTGSYGDDLETIFYYGNFQSPTEQPKLSRSLSVGDTIKYKGHTLMIMPFGWRDVTGLTDDAIAAIQESPNALPTAAEWRNAEKRRKEAQPPAAVKEGKAGKATPIVSNPDILEVRPDAKPDILSGVETGKAVSVDVVRGSGRATKGEVYATGEGEPAFGPARYSAIDETVAEAFGPNIEKLTVQLDNPFVLTNDEQLAELVGEPVPRDDTLRPAFLKKARAEIEKGGYDGIIINVPNFGDIDTAGKSAKRLIEISGATQIVEFAPQPPAAVTKGKQPWEMTKEELQNSLIKAVRAEIPDIEIHENSDGLIGTTKVNGKITLYVDKDRLFKTQQNRATLEGGNSQEAMQAAYREEAIHARQWAEGHGDFTSKENKQAWRALPESVQMAVKETRKHAIGEPIGKLFAEFDRMRTQLQEGGHITEWYHPKLRAAAEKAEKAILEEIARRAEAVTEGKVEAGKISPKVEEYWGKGYMITAGGQLGPRIQTKKIKGKPAIKSKQLITKLYQAVQNDKIDRGVFNTLQERVMDVISAERLKTRAGGLTKFQKQELAEAPTFEEVSVEIDKAIVPAAVKEGKKKPKAKPVVLKPAGGAVKKGFTPDPTIPTVAKGEPGFAGVQGRPGGKAEKPWLDMDKAKSRNKDIEDFFGRTKRSPYSRKASKLIAAIKTGLRERFVTMTPHIENIPETAIYRDMIRTLPEEVRQAGQNAAKDIISVLDNDGTVQALDTPGLDLLRRKVFIQDILHEAEISRSISGGFNKAELEVENRRLDALIAKVPSVKRAYETRQKLWNDVSQDLLKRGVLDAETAKNKHYVRHFVLDLAEKNFPTGFKRKRLSAPYRAYRKQRKGSIKDISTDYLEVEVRALSQIYRDNAIEDIANKVSELADKRKLYTTEARKENIEKAGQPPAGLKGFAVDKWLREKLGGKYITPEKLAQKDGYVEWHYKRPNLFYRAHTLAESQIASLVESSAEEAGSVLKVPKEVMREALVLGRRKGMIIPDWLAKQLDDLPVNKRSNYVVRSFTKPFVQFWKRWILRVNPFRYNARNQLGDTERLHAAGQTRAVKNIPEAVKILITKEGELYDLMKKHGVAGSTLWHEMNDVSTIKEFEKFKDYSKPTTFVSVTKKAFSLPLKTASKIGSVEQNITQFREDILRAAVFINNYNKLQEGKPVRHWAGKIADIEEIAKTDKARAAAKISRETLGDYGAFTPFETDVLRQGIIPFYSWMKINTVFWPRVLKNAAADGTVGKPLAAAATLVGRNIAKWLIRALWAYAAAYLWNNRSETARTKERSLPFWVRAMPHITIGKYTLWGQTALSDFVEWFDMESLASIAWRRMSGFLSKKEATIEAARIIAEAPVNKIYQSFNPFMKAPITAITGQETWPTVFEPHFVASPASKNSFERAVLNVLGSDAKRFYQTAQGDRKFEDTLYAYFAGWWARPTDAETLIEEIKRTKEWTSLKRKSKVTGRGPGEAKKGKEVRWQEAETRARAIGIRTGQISRKILRKKAPAKKLIVKK